MLRYQRERHVSRLKQRLAAASAAAPGLGRHEADVASDVARDHVEELMRELMVVQLGARRAAGSWPQSFSPALRAFVACCDPADLRQMDVLHNFYEASIGNSTVAGGALPLGGYSDVLRVHAERLASAAIRQYHVSLGEKVPVVAHGPSLRTLVLADDFVGGARVWKAIAGARALSAPRLLICNNQRRGEASYRARLAASLALVMIRGGWRTAVSMLRSGPRVSQGQLVDPSNTAWLRAGGFDVGLHCMGVIYRSETIATFKLGILNAHIGHLPGMRGRSVLEWSLVFGIDPCVSTFFIDEGIDTGNPIVDRLHPPRDVVGRAASITAAKRGMFDLDGCSYARALETLANGGDGFHNAPLGARFYVMSALLSGAIEAS
jgi:hypothetical protein